MANTLTNVVPQILAQGLMALRGATIMPRLVNTDYGTEAARKGSTIDIPLPASMTASAVSPSAAPTAAPDVTPGTVAITLDKWYESAFHLTDKEQEEAAGGIIPMQVSEAVKALAEQVNSDMFALYKDVYGFVGTAGTTPFASNTSDVTAARKTLNNQNAPLRPRFLVADPDAEANALDLRAFQDFSWSNSDSVIVDGDINTKLGFGFVMDQQVPTHTAGTGSGYLINSASVAVGDTSVAVDTGTGTILEGDVFTVAGDTQTYTATADMSGGTLSFSPAAKVAWADNAAVTIKADHVANLAFHRDAFALVTRPLSSNNAAELGSVIESAVDPVSGLTLRLEVTRQNKQTKWSFDILYGVATIRPELAARIAG